LKLVLEVGDRCGSRTSASERGEEASMRFSHEPVGVKVIREATGVEESSQALFLSLVG